MLLARPIQSVRPLVRASVPLLTTFAPCLLALPMPCPKGASGPAFLRAPGSLHGFPGLLIPSSFPKMESTGSGNRGELVATPL